MALQFVLPSIDDLPDNIKPLYKKREDGKFQLEAEGVVDKTKLDEFRANNVALAESNKDMIEKLKKLEGIDPDKYKAFLDKFQSDEEKKLLKDGNLDEVIKLRTAGIVKDSTEQMAAKDKIIAKLTEDTKTATREKDSYIVEAEMRKSLDNPDLGFQPGVANILKDSVLKEFVHKDGKVIRVKSDGSLVYGKSGDPMGLDEFVQGYAKDHPYLVKPSGGGGARNETTKGAGSNGHKTMPRSEFNKLDAAAQSKFMMTDKGVLVDT